MICTLHRTALILSLLIVADTGAAAQAQALTPAGMAQAWTGTRTPSCAPKPATLSTAEGSKFCVWRRGDATWDSVEVYGTRQPNGRIAHVIWARRMRDSVSAEAFGDSLSRALVPQGLKAYVCQKIDMRVWLRADVAVTFSIGAKEQPAGTYRAGVQVVDDPTAIPSDLCPNLPRIPASQRKSLARTRIGP